MLNFFLDRDIIPIEITFERVQSRSDLLDIFESLKSKIGSPHNYGLSKQEQEEIHRLKAEMERREAAVKAEIERQKAQKEFEKNEEQIKEWVRVKSGTSFDDLHLNISCYHQTNEMLQKKRQEVAEIEQHSLPTRHYLMKYIMPSITTGLTEVAKMRPKKPVEFLAKFMLASQENDETDDPDQEVVNEFRKIVKNVNDY